MAVVPVALSVSFVLIAGIAIAVVRQTRHTSAPFIASRIQTGGRYQVRVLASGGTWDPSKPLGLDNPLWGAADATYWLDPDGTVHLQLRRSGSSMTEHRSGPMPAKLAGPRPRVHRREWIIAVAVYAGACVLGFGVGFAVSSGSGLTRSAYGVFGVFGAMVAMSLLVLIIRAATSVRRLGVRQPNDQ